jgi:phage terminase large subunit GpA-like protein
MTSLRALISEWCAGAWAPPAKLKPSEWVEAHRVLPVGVTAEPGPMRLDRTPYVRGILDAVADPLVEEITWVKPTQVGGSETGRNLLGYWIDVDPGPCLVVMPDEKSGKEAIEERIRPMLESSPKLRAHVSSRAWDNKLSSIKLDTMPIFVGWAGSPQSLASRPCRYVFFDECDKYPPFAAREADPISLGTERTATYGHRRKIVKTSTPTTREGPIWRAWEACGDRRHYHVPCPHCGTYQRLLWQQVKWPKLNEPDKVKLADQVEQARLAWYECQSCKGRIDDRHKPKMLSAGRWESDSPGAASKRVGFHLNAIYSPWRTFAAIAAEFIRANGDPGATMNFRNSWLAEPFENLITTTRPSAIRDKAMSAGKPGEVPQGASALIATADTQKDHFYWTVRWWGYGYRSGLVAHGICQTFDELQRICLESRFAFAGGSTITPSHLLLDSGGDRTNEVYQFALRDPGRIVPCKGSSHQMSRPWTNSPQPNGLVLRWVDTGYFKDMLARLINDPDQAKWMPNSTVDDDYCQQMASEHKIIDRKSGKTKWEPVTSGARNHLWDCEVLQCVAADMLQLGHAAPLEPQQQEQSQSGERVARFGGSKRW